MLPTKPETGAGSGILTVVCLGVSTYAPISISYVSSFIESTQLTKEPDLNNILFYRDVLMVRLSEICTILSSKSSMKLIERKAKFSFCFDWWP